MKKVISSLLMIVLLTACNVPFLQDGDNATPPPLSEVVPATEAPTEAPVATEPPVTGNTFGEGDNNCTGPGITETELEGGKAVIKVDTGLVFQYSEGDSWCAETSAFQDQAWLNDRWPTHLAEYFAKAENAGAKAYVLLSDGTLQEYSESAQPVGTPMPLLPEIQMQNPEAGTLAWHNDPLENGEARSASPVGQLNSDLYILGETWGPDGSYVFTVAPGGVAWLQGHYGGTAWWIAMEADLEAEIAKHVASLEARDGVKPAVVRMPQEGFSLIGCYQTRPVENNTRFCDAVDGVEAFSVPAQDPLPGYFPETITGVTAVAGKCENGKATGPAVVETVVGGVPTIVRVDEGKTYNYGAYGCTPYESQSKLLADWDAWVADFTKKYPNAQSLIAP